MSLYNYGTKILFNFFSDLSKIVHPKISHNKRFSSQIPFITHFRPSTLTISIPLLHLTPPLHHRVGNLHYGTEVYKMLTLTVMQVI